MIQLRHGILKAWGSLRLKTLWSESGHWGFKQTLAFSYFSLISFFIILIFIINIVGCIYNILDRIKGEYKEIINGLVSGRKAQKYREIPSSIMIWSKIESATPTITSSSSS